MSITLSYDAVEDRIHLASRLDDQRRMGLWLNQRMARQLVVALSAHLEKVEAVPLSSIRDELMAYEQAQAVSGLKPLPPVTAEADAPAHLVTNIALHLGADNMELRFDSASDCSPRIVLDRTYLRQWLSMLHRQFVTGEWPLDVWPIWLTEGVPQAAGATRH